jgi:hypothetical protein
MLQAQADNKHTPHTHMHDAANWPAKAQAWPARDGGEVTCAATHPHTERTGATPNKRRATHTHAKTKSGDMRTCAHIRRGERCNAPCGRTANTHKQSTRMQERRRWGVVTCTATHSHTQEQVHRARGTHTHERRGTRSGDKHSHALTRTSEEINAKCHRQEKRCATPCDGAAHTHEREGGWEWPCAQPLTHRKRGVVRRAMWRRGTHTYERSRDERWWHAQPRTD